MTSQARYKGPRLSRPRTIDSYAAITETFQYTFANADPYPNSVYLVPSGSDMNQIQGFEPRFTAQSFITNTNPMCHALYQRFDEFRIRAVEVKITSQVLNPVNFSRSDVWIWWTPNHFNEDEDAKVGDAFDNVTDMEEAARVSRVCVMPGKTLRLNVVPQIVMVNEMQTVGALLPANGDRPAPWLRCSSTNISDISFRMPVIYFRKPYNQGFADRPDIYHITLTACIEFRQLDDDN